MVRSNRRINLKNRRILNRADYLDHNSYARDLLRSGGPDLGDIGHLGGGSGFYSQVLTATWEASLAEFDQALAYELTLEQVNRPHIFVKKWRR